MTATTEKIQNFLEKRKTYCYKKGEVILRSGDLPQGIMFLKSGFTRLESVSAEGKELTLVIYRADDFFPVVWTFFGERPSIYNLEALTDCEVIRVPREDFLDFLKADVDVFFDVTRHIITRFQLTLQRMTYLTFGNASAKLASILLICGKEYGVKKNEGIEIQIPLTHKDISNLVGVTRETISIELKKFDRRGLIAYNRKLIILKDLKALEQKAILS